MKNEKIAVLSPRGIPPTIQLIPMAPRLDTLTGKTIYIVDVGFPTMHEALEELLKILAGKYPETKWVLRTKIGTYFHNDPDLWAEIKEKGNGAIIGIGQLDTCAPSVIIFCSILEKMGIPTAPVVTEAFPELTRNFAYKKGMPKLRFTFVPHPFAARPIELRRKYLNGNDPLNGKPVVQGIFDALTKPTTAEEMKTGLIERLTPKLPERDTQENMERFFLESGWTDYLPIVLPTEERVAEMLKGTSHKPEEIIGRMQPIPPNEVWENSTRRIGGGAAMKRAENRQSPVAMQPSPPHEAWEYTVKHVAINAVMAGAKKEHLPVILAIASTGTTSLFSSATSFARMVVVNGPVRKEIKMNCGLAALGPFNHANAVIGRAWTLISKNLGTATLGETYLGDLGNNLNYNNVCFAENEEALPEGWNPLHVQKGFKPGESVVSLLSGWSLIDYGAYKPYPHNEAMRQALTAFETSGNGKGRPTFLVGPVTAKDLKGYGFDSKDKLSRWLKENTYQTLWDYWASKPEDLASAKAGVEPFASWLKLPPGAKSPQPLYQPEAAVEIVVVGGGTETAWSVGDFGCMASASIDFWR